MNRIEDYLDRALPGLADAAPVVPDLAEQACLRYDAERRARRGRVTLATAAVGATLVAVPSIAQSLNSTGGRSTLPVTAGTPAVAAPEAAAPGDPQRLVMAPEGGLTLTLPPDWTVVRHAPEGPCQTKPRHVYLGGRTGRPQDTAAGAVRRTVCPAAERGPWLWYDDEDAGAVRWVGSHRLPGGAVGAAAEVWPFDEFTAPESPTLAFSVRPGAVLYAGAQTTSELTAAVEQIVTFPFEASGERLSLPTDAAGMTLDVAADGGYRAPGAITRDPQVIQRVVARMEGLPMADPQDATSCLPGWSEELQVSGPAPWAGLLTLGNLTLAIGDSSCPYVFDPTGTAAVIPSGTDLPDEITRLITGHTN